MKQTLQLRLGQHLTMTPQLQQAIRLLQLSTLDLSQEIQEALNANPLLETEEEHQQLSQLNGKDQPTNELRNSSPDSTPANDINNEREIQTDSSSITDELPVDSEWDDVYDSYSPSTGPAGEGTDSEFLLQRGNKVTLQDHLLWQLNLTPFSPLDRAIATSIIDAINNDGYFTGDLDEIRFSIQAEEIDLEDVEMVLHRIQAFDPPGVGAQNPQDCLLIQLRQLPEETPYRQEAITLCQDHFKHLANQDQAQIKRRMQIDDDTLSGVTQLIRSLHPRPH